MRKQPPTNLPEGFREIWKAIAETDKVTASRQLLAKELGISTNTIQRILVDGDVPDFTSNPSRRILHSWTRIITKLALYFNHDPYTWVKMVDISLEDRITEIINSEITRITESIQPSGMKAQRSGKAIHTDCTSSFYENLGKKVLTAITPELKRVNILGKGSKLLIDTEMEVSASASRDPEKENPREERYCHSCLAALNDAHNAGASEIYCRHCSDEDGNLLPREHVLSVIAQWFMRWQKDLSESEARRRADLYMQSMPAWN